MGLVGFGRPESDRLLLVFTFIGSGPWLKKQVDYFAWAFGPDCPGCVIYVS